MAQTKYIFVTGGVLSGLGKGITAASIGNVLKARGLRVNIQKCDPYLNVDAGTLNPAEHGECYVTKDGAETDLDLGHYERFMDQELTQASSMMAGRVLGKVIADERRGKYGGKTVQYIPHVTNAFQKEIIEAGKGYDVHIAEVGGTVGDYESLALIESIRELAMKVGRDTCLFVHVVYMPYLGASKEIKSKPAQNAVRELRGFGISPDILIARSEVPAPEKIKQKLSLFSGVPPEAIALLPNAQTIYQVPVTLEETGISRVICHKLDLDGKRPYLSPWRTLVSSILAEPKQRITIGIIAKYMDNYDTYMSVTEALAAAGWQQSVQVSIRWVDAEALDAHGADVAQALAGCDGILVPGGFGQRALEGKIKAARYALQNKLPYLGICLGLQMAVVAAARNAGMEGATSQELDDTAEHQLITTMVGQENKANTGGTMRLGDYDCQLITGSLAAQLYGTQIITERHRHRFECNNTYRPDYESWGIVASGTSPDGTLVEVIEAPDHPYFIATQAHPEFRSRPNKPHPLFAGLVSAAKKS